MSKEKDKALEQYENEMPDEKYYHLSNSNQLNNQRKKHTIGAMNWLDKLEEKYKKWNLSSNFLMKNKLD